MRLSAFLLSVTAAGGVGGGGGAFFLFLRKIHFSGAGVQFVGNEAHDLG
jgi:hypothetical protein